MAENNSTRKQEEMEEGTLRARVHAKRNAVKQRRNPKMFLNLFDLIVIFLILLAVVLLAVGVRMTDLFGGGNQGEPVRLSYTLTLYDVDASFADQIAVGDALYDVDTKAMLGTVQQTPTTEPHKVLALITASDGKVSAVMQAVPERVDITVRVTAEASYLESVGYTIEGKNIRIGKTYSIRFPGYIGNAECVALNGAVKITQ